MNRGSVVWLVSVPLMLAGTEVVHALHASGVVGHHDQDYASILMNAELTAIFFVLLAYHLLHSSPRRSGSSRNATQASVSLLAQATLDPEGANDNG